MKLPQFNNTTYYRHYTNLRGNPSEGHSIQMQADDEGGDIYACTRGVGGGADQPTSCGPCHCYLKLIRRGELADSRGYFVQGPAEEWDTSGTCSLVKKNASKSDWDAVKNAYDRKKAAEYSLGTNNCCTAAVEAANSVPGGGAPVRLYTANAGVGTVCILQ